MMRPSASVRRSEFSSAAAKPSASVKMRSISASPRSSIDTTSYLGKRAMLLGLADQDAVETIDLAEFYEHPLTLGRRDVLADEVRANRHLALAAIDQHRELNRFGAAQIGNCAERRAHRAAGVEHVIDKNDAFAVERERDVAAEQTWIAGRALLVIAIRGNIEGADGNLGQPNLLEREDEAFGECRTAPDNPNQHEVGRTGIALGDFMREA